jgi:hypothetical protein
MVRRRQPVAWPATHSACYRFGQSREAESCGHVPSPRAKDSPNSAMVVEEFGPRDVAARERDQRISIILRGADTEPFGVCYSLPVHRPP